ncbi:MAG: four helix bundle protein [Ignavibacteria bacterium]|jgi:four helix bundle protein
MSQKSLVLVKAKQLAVHGIHFARFLRNDISEHDISRQLLRSITAPGALIAEATDSESPSDMHHKFGIALKECRECEYWIDILLESALIRVHQVTEIQSMLNEVTAILVSSRKTLKLRMK